VSVSEGYQLVRRIGTSISGTVYLARSETRELAIRQFESGADHDSAAWRDERTAFLQAGNQEVALRSPRIVPVFEVIDEAGEAFVVMEYVPESTLATALQGGRRFTPEETDAILVQIAAALDFAHGRGVVHGDLRPADVFLSHKGALVSDFAISPRARRTAMPVPHGSVHEYLSPEHLRDSAAIGPRSDQYSLAVIAYQMYTGRSPYGDNVADLSEAILTTPVVPPSQVYRQLPSSLDAPLLKALSRDPSQRYGSCGELVAALGASLITRPEAEGRQVSKLVYILAPALVLLLLALMWFSRSKRPAVVAKPPLVAVKPPAPSPTPQPSIPVRKSTKPEAPASTKTAGKQPRLEDSRVTPPAAPRPTPARASTVDNAAPAVAAIVNPHFSIDVLSRGTHRIENGSSFPLLDPQLGELGQGDLAALISFEGRHPPRGLRLEWTLDGVIADSKVVVLNPENGAGQAMVAYGNEPSAGTYRVTLKLKNHEVQSFTFRITQ